MVYYLDKNSENKIEFYYKSKINTYITYIVIVAT
jgi:hypothetical protein